MADSATAGQQKQLVGALKAIDAALASGDAETVTTKVKSLCQMRFKIPASATVLHRAMKRLAKKLSKSTNPQWRSLATDVREVFLARSQSGRGAAAAGGGAGGAGGGGAGADATAAEPAARLEALSKYMSATLNLAAEPPPHDLYAKDYGFDESEACRANRILFVDEFGDTHVSSQRVADSMLSEGTAAGASSPAPPASASTPRRRVKQEVGESPQGQAAAGASLGAASPSSKCVVYWMSRDQRVCDNWALLRAQQVAEARGQSLVVAFCLFLPAGFLGATGRHFGFMLRGLRHVEHDLHDLGIPFVVLPTGPDNGGSVEDVVTKFARDVSASLIVADFSPLRIAKQWRANLGGRLAALSPPVQYEVVDAHNVVPVWVTSDKVEFSARTIRIKLWKKAPDWMQQAFPSVKPQRFKSEHSMLQGQPVDWAQLLDGPAGLSSLDWTVPEVDWAVPGERAAHKALRGFLQNRLSLFATQRNDPCSRNACSNLSPYFHFGQISPARVILELMRLSKRGPKHFFVKDRTTGPQVFVEEFLIRRELSDNFCYFCDDYDNINGAHAWARSTIEAHRADRREYVYSRDELEACQTHDPLWNAAQAELVQRGKMAGFMRMYWAKKILEWTESTEQALEFSIYLNDRYSLDGRDPNGYVGCMWSIVGTHDRAWTERPVFGKIRFMNYNGCKRKFNIEQYIAMNPVRNNNNNPGSSSSNQKKKKGKLPEKRRQSKLRLDPGMPAPKQKRP